MRIIRKSSAQGLLILMISGALSGCSLLQKITGPSELEIKKSLDSRNCKKIISYLSREVPPKDYLHLQYALKCDLTHTFELEQPDWYQPLLLELREKQALASPQIEDDQKIWFEQAKNSTQKKEKEQLYQKIIESAPESALALDAQKALWELSPRLSPDHDKLDPMVIANDYRAAIENEKALQLYHQILKKLRSDEEKLTILEQIRQTLRSLQKKEEQLLITKQIFEIQKQRFKKQKDKFASQYLSSGLLYGRAVWTANRPSEARKIFLQLAEDLPTDVNQTELQWVLGKLEDEQKNEEQALLHFQKSLSYSEGPFTNRALWSAAWLDYKMGRFAEARKLLLELAQKDPTENRARYWATRALEQLDSSLSQQSEEEYRLLLEADPMGYYGLLAQRALGEPFTPLKSSTTKVGKKALKNYLKKSEFIDLKALIELADPRDLQYAVEKVATRVPASDVESQYELSLLFASGKLYLPLLVQIQKLDADSRHQLLKLHPELLFPVDYFEVIQPAALKQSVPPEFVLSIIRQESTFNRFARSPVDALGLMQMMPRLAEKKAAQLKISYEEPADLFKPEVNIPLGIDELNDLLRRYQQSYILASAGYNASPAAIRGWLEQRYRADVTEFIEEVGYDETRSYIKLVLRNFVFYRRLVSTEPFTFPNEILKMPSQRTL